MLDKTIAEKGLYTSFEVKTVEAKKNLFNALNSKLPSLETKINNTISVVSVIVKKQTFTNDSANGGTREGWRIVLTLEDGEIVAASGNAVFTCIDNAISIFGTPSKTNPLKFKVLQNQSGANSMYKYLSLQIV